MKYKLVNAEQLEADLASVADSIRSKAGISGELEFPNGFKNAIDGIVINNGVTVKKKSGYLMVTNGAATANCGFKPDFVYISRGDQGDGFLAEMGFAFNESGKDNLASGMPGTGYNYFALCKRSSSGFSLSGFAQIGSESQSTYYGNVNYVAVKYT